MASELYRLEHMTEFGTITGNSISHYRILEKLGGGGMGVVYKAEDSRLERFVALKFLPGEFANDPQMRERFLREARAASALNHPNICTIYDVGEENGRIFIAMEFLDGVTLRELVKDGPLELKRLLNLADQVLNGLEAAHNEGIVHRDIKLGNIFVTKSGRAKIMDFGLAKKTASKPAPAVVAHTEKTGLAEEHLTSGLAALGTAAYMSPEQALGKPLDTRTDLFSFGIVLYEMATGRAPFQGDSTGMLLLSIVQEIPKTVRQINPGVPEGLQEIIDKCLQKERTQRYQTAYAIRDDLRKLEGGFEAQEGGPVAVAAGEVTAKESVASTGTREIAAVAPSGSIGTGARNVSLMAVAVAVAATLVVGWYVHERKTMALKPRDSVVLADFTNTTGEPIFDGSLKQAARFDLEESPFLNVLADRRVDGVLQLMNRPANQRLSQEVAREVCLRTGSKAVIAPSISKMGAGYQISMKALACETGNEIASGTAEAARREKVIGALAKADSQLRRRLGESLPSLEKFNHQLEETTTSSLEALQTYTAGLQAFQLNSLAEAIPYLRQAVELDPNFAQAHASLGAVYYGAGETILAEESFAKAYELRNRVSERERFSITANYFRRVTGQTEESIATCKEWIRLYPDDYAAYLALGGSYLSVGEFEKAAEASRDAIQLSPERTAAYINAMVAYKNLDRYDEAKAIFDLARSRNLDNDVLRINRYVIAFLEKDTAGMEEQVKWADGKKGTEDRLREDQAAAEAYYGRYARSRGLGKQAVAAALRDGMKERSLEFRGQAALREAEIGNKNWIGDWTPEGIDASHGQVVKVMLALAFAKAGDNGRALRLADELGQQKTQHAMIQKCYVPMIRAQVEINRHRPENALKTLQPALEMERATSVIDAVEAAYVRGEAYLQAKRGREAATEFQKLIDHPGLVEMSVTGALARLQLARAEELTGDGAAAQRHYQDFLALWKDADGDLPVLKAAKAEYAQLH